MAAAYGGSSPARAWSSGDEPRGMPGPPNRASAPRSARKFMGSSHKDLQRRVRESYARGARALFETHWTNFSDENVLS